MPDATSEHEETILGAMRGGDLGRAATLTIEAHGGDVRRMLGALLRDDAAAREAYAQFCEDLWRGLPGFRGACSLRGWAMTLARHAALRVVRRERVQWRIARAFALEPAREASGPECARREAILDALRRRLTEEEQALLSLRVDRALAWRDIALELCGGSAARDTAAVRKRFERLKTRLSALARTLEGAHSSS